MLFAHLKRILGLAAYGRAAHAVRKMSSPLAAIAQNLRRLALIIAKPPPDSELCAA
jgi:hypothetical protein